MIGADNLLPLDDKGIDRAGVNGNWWIGLSLMHTVEWTPAIIAHPTTRFATRANWWGMEMERLSRLAWSMRCTRLVSNIRGRSRCTISRRPGSD
jgi:hypothetical protein